MSQKKSHDPRLVFLDLETTGLDKDKDDILEIGILVVDVQTGGTQSFQLTRKYLFLNEEEIRNSMDPVVYEMHKKSGLIDEVLDEESDICANTVCLQKNALSWLRGLGFSEENKATLCGYSPHFDRGFLKAQMPSLEQLFHHRHIDVSSFRGWLLRHQPNIETVLKSRLGETEHRALADCRKAYEELKMFRVTLVDEFDPSKNTGVE